MSEDVKVVKAKNEQSQAAKRATLEKMKAKKAATDEFEVTFPGDDEPSSFLFKACPAFRYDELMTLAPPLDADRARGLTYNPTAFSALLLSEVCLEPKFSPEDWTSVLKSDGWSGGDTGDLYNRAIDLCTKGLNITPTAAG